MTLLSRPILFVNEATKQSQKLAVTHTDAYLVISLRENIPDVCCFFVIVFALLLCLYIRRGYRLSNTAESTGDQHDVVQLREVMTDASVGKINKIQNHKINLQREGLLQ